MAYRQASTFVPQYVDANGVPLNSGTISAFLAGTTTATPMYSDIDGTSAGAIITLNAIGMPEVSGNTIMIWLDTAIDYKFVLKDSSGVAIWTIDDIGVEDANIYGQLYSSGNATADASVTATPSRVVEGWTANGSSNLITPSYAAGTLTVLAGGGGTYRVSCHFGWSGTASKLWTFYLYKNTATPFGEAGSATESLGIPSQFVTAFGGCVSLAAGDTVSLYVKSTDGGTSFTMAYGELFMERIGA
jgi:hypothetical protein